MEADGAVPLKAPSQWKPLLLLIPLRLGLSEINPIYINGLKVIKKSILAWMAKIGVKYEWS